MIETQVLHYEVSPLLDKGTFIKDFCSSFSMSEELLDYQLLADYMQEFVFLQDQYPVLCTPSNPIFPHLA